METRIKTGDDLKCEITAASEKALIKLYTADGSETPWIGIEALSQAHDLLALITGHRPKAGALKASPKHEPQSQGQPELLQEDAEGEDAPPPPPPPPPQNGKLPRQVVEDLRAFEQDLVQLMENPPDSGPKSTHSGLPEIEVRRLVGDYQRRFRDPQQMFIVLQHHMGMDRARFQKILEMNSKRT